MAAPAAIGKVFDAVETAREARLLRVASRKKTTSSAYRSGAKHYKVELTVSKVFAEFHPISPRRC